MSPLTFILPADLPAICHTVALGVALRCFDGGARVDEEKTGHGEGDERSRDGAGVDFGHGGPL